MNQTFKNATAYLFMSATGNARSGSRNHQIIFDDNSFTRLLDGEIDVLYENIVQHEGIVNLYKDSDQNPTFIVPLYTTLDEHVISNENYDIQMGLIVQSKMGHIHKDMIEFGNKLYTDKLILSNVTFEKCYFVFEIEDNRILMNIYNMNKHKVASVDIPRYRKICIYTGINAEVLSTTISLS